MMPTKCSSTGGGSSVSRSIGAGGTTEKRAVESQQKKTAMRGAQPHLHMMAIFNF